MTSGYGLPEGVVSSLAPSASKKLETSFFYEWAAGQVPVEREIVDKVFTPAEKICQHCLKNLSVYRKRERVGIHDLTEDWRATIIIKVCKNKDCPFSLYKTKEPAREGILIKPIEFDRDIFPYYHVTKSVIEEVGRLFHSRHLNYHEVKLEFQERYGLKISERTINRWDQLYQSWQQACNEQLSPLYREKLQGLSIITWQVDGSVSGANHEVARVIEPVTRLHLSSVPVEARHCGRPGAFIEVLEKAKERFGEPVLVIHDDDSSIEAAISKVLPGVAIQTCIFHVMDNNGEDLFDGLASDLKKLLQKKSYRKALQAVVKDLQSRMTGGLPPRAMELLQIVDILIKPAVATYHYQPVILRKMDLFVDAGTFLQKRLALIKGKLPREGQPEDGILELRQLKSQFPKEIVRNWLQSPVVQEDPATSALVRIAGIVHGIVTDKKFKQLYRTWKVLNQEFQRLQSIFYGAFLDSVPPDLDDSQEDSFPGYWEFKKITGEQKSIEDKMKKITPANNFWINVKHRPGEITRDYALRRLNSLIKIWEDMTDDYPQLKGVIKRLKKKKNQLFTFCGYPGQSFHQQAIESDNATIKRNLRKRSGHSKFKTRWILQEQALSQIANTVQPSPETTPAYRLGIKKAVICAMLYSIDWSLVKKYRERQRAARLPSILHRRAYKDGFGSIFKTGASYWIQAIISGTLSYLERMNVEEKV